MIPILLLGAFGLIAGLFILHAVQRYRATPGTNFLSAFENDLTSAIAHIGVVLGSLDAGVQQFVGTYGSILLDGQTKDLVTEFLPNMNVGMGFAAFSLIIRLVQASSIVSLPPKGSG